MEMDALGAPGRAHARPHLMSPPGRSLLAPPPTPPRNRNPATHQRQRRPDKPRAEFLRASPLLLVGSTGLHRGGRGGTQGRVGRRRGEPQTFHPLSAVLNCVSLGFGKTFPRKFCREPLVWELTAFGGCQRGGEKAGVQGAETALRPGNPASSVDGPGSNAS